MAHKHSVYDTDSHFKINAVTHAIQNTSGKIALIQGDHNSERFTFEIPRKIDDHDMSLCDVVQVHYINIDSANKTNVSKDVYDVTDLDVSPDDNDVVICSWLIDGNATKYAGSLNFLVKFKCTTNGVTDYVWNTAIHSGVSVSSGMDNGEVIVEDYSDVLEQWRYVLFENAGVTDEQVDNAVARYLSEHPVSAGSKATIGTVDLLADNWQGSDNLYSQIVTIDGVTENSQVDLTPSVEQLVIFYAKDLTLVAENDGGVVTVYAIGQKPTNDYSIQVTITEVTV